jgi:hypothetical protein
MAMKNLVAIITLSLIYCNLSTLEAQMAMYRGTVEYHLEISKTANGGGIDGGYNWNVSVNEKQIIDGIFFATFTGKVIDSDPVRSGLSLSNIQESIQFTNNVNNEGNEQKISEACYDDRLVFKRNATPGESRTERFGVNWSRSEPDKKVIEGGNISFRNNNYYLTLMGKVKLNVSTENYSSLTQPCLDTVIPPKSISANTTLNFPIVIYAEKPFDNSDVLDGIYVQLDESGDDCNMSFGDLARMVHGDMNCSYVTKITTSWTLVKRTRECDATISYLKGDVKINGFPAKEGATKIGKGDVITTGPKARIEVKLSDGTTYRIGSRTRLSLINPCATSGEPSLGSLLRGKFYSKVRELTGGGNFSQRSITGAVGVRGHISPELPLFYASADPDFVPCVFQHDFPLPGCSTVQQEDPEKAELIDGYQSLPDSQTAYYLDFEDGIVRDLTALRGTIRVEDEMGIRSMDVPEGKTVTHWEDGTQMTEIVILTK